MAEPGPFVASGDFVYVDPGPTKLRWKLCRIDHGVDPEPAAAARLIAEVLNASEKARKAVL
jgi:hypothetical protein